MADGSVKIDVEMITKSAEEKLKDLTNKVRDNADDIDKNLQLDTEKLANDFEKAKSKVEDLNSRLKDTEAQLQKFLELENKRAMLTAQIDEGLMTNKAINQAYEAGNLSQEKRNEMLSYNNKLLKDMSLEVDQLTTRLTAMDNVKLEDTASKLKDQLNSATISYDSLGIRAEKLDLRIDKNVDKTRKLKEEMKLASETTKQTAINAEAISTGVSGATRKLGKYVLALFGIRSAYTMLRRLSNAWLNSDAEGARQVKANIDAITQGLANALAPVLMWITDLLGRVFAYANALLKAFFGIDLLSKKTNKNVGGVAKGTAKARKEAEKFLASFDKAEVVTSKMEDNLGGSSGGGGSMDLEANFPTVDASPLIKAFEQLRAVLEPLKPHLDYFINQFAKPFITWLREIFVPKAIDLLYAGFQLLVAIVAKVLEGMIEWWEFIKPVFVWLGDIAVGALEGITESIQELTGKVFENDEGFGDLFKTLGFVLGAFLTVKAIVLIVSSLLGALTFLIKPLVAIFGVLKTIVVAVAGVFSAAFGGSVLAIIAIVAVLGTMLLGLITNFEQVKKDFMVIVNHIKGIFIGLYEFIAGVFTGNWKRAFKGLADAIAHAFAGIVNIVKFPINIIVDGVNAMIRGLNKIKIPSWVPAVGGKGINLPQIPRLARGHYADSGSLQALIGENGKEAVVPLENNKSWARDFLGVLDEYGGMGGSQQPVIAKVNGRTLFEVHFEEKRRNRLIMNGGV